MNKRGYCTVTSVWGGKLVCVQESGFFTSFHHSKQVDTTESITGATIVPAITSRFVDLPG